MYKYETHLHTYPASECGGADVRETLEFYKKQGFDGVFITNHFLDGNINAGYRNLPYKEQLEKWFSDYENGVEIGKEIGIKVFLGVELSYKGTDFLVYGLDKKWFVEHEEIMTMKKSDELTFLMENGAFIIQAHPFRERGYIDHIRLFPRVVHGVEVLNSTNSDFENKMAEIYADNYGLLKTGGSDNHNAGRAGSLAAMVFDNPLENEQDFIESVKKCDYEIVTIYSDQYK